MKKLGLLVASILFLAIETLAQTDAQLTTENNNNIRGKIFSSTNTANMFSSIINSKLNKQLSTGNTAITIPLESQLMIGSGTGANDSRITFNINDVRSGVISLRANNGSGTFSSFTLDGNGISFTTNSATFQGVRYGLDYSANYVARSLPDVNWVTNGTYSLINKTLGAGTVFSNDPTINAGIKFTFSPNTTKAGLNVGSFAGNPTSLENGDVWYNSTGGTLFMQISNQTHSIPGLSVNQNWLGLNVFPNNGISARFSLGNLSNNDPSSVNNGEMWYNGVQNNFRGRANNITGTIALNPITNNTELLASTASGAIQSSDFLSNSTTKTLGLTTNAATTQTLTVNGSSANVGLTLTSKGTGVLSLVHGSTPGNKINVQGNEVNMTHSTGNAFSINNGSGSGRFTFNNSASSDLRINPTTNSFFGTAVLVGGTVTVSNTRVTANSIIFLAVVTAGGTQGFLRVSAITAGTSFTITSTSATETSEVAYLMIN